LDCDLFIVCVHLLDQALLLKNSLDEFFLAHSHNFHERTIKMDDPSSLKIENQGIFNGFLTESSEILVKYPQDMIYSIVWISNLSSRTESGC
jgi:hypothetical protein